jgi:hypothetical protein
MTELFEIFKKTKLTPNRIPTLFDATDSHLNDVVTVINQNLPTRKLSGDSHSPFSFVSNSQMGGGRTYCRHSNCRFSAAENLANNAALYADHIYLQNPFEYYARIDHFDQEHKYDLANDIFLLFLFKPLIEKGIISYCDQDYHFCEDCYRNFTKKFDPNYESKFKKTEKELNRIVSETVKFKVIDNNGTPALELSNIVGISDHDIIYTFRKLPKIVKDKFRKGKSSKLTADEIKKSKVYQIITQSVLNDLDYQDYYSKLYDASVLTNRSIDFDLINSTNLISNSQIKFDLNHELPFMQNVPLKKLIELRKKEGEAFEVYRNSVTKAIKETEKQRGTQQPKKKEIYNDLIRPEINKIDLTIKNSKKLIFGNIKQDLILGTSFVGIALASGFLPNNIGQVVSAIGGIKFADQFASNVRKLLTTPQEIRNNPYYFLWKVKRLAEKSTSA